MSRNAKTRAAPRGRVGRLIRALDTVTPISPDESVLVVAHPDCDRLAAAFVLAARHLGANVRRTPYPAEAADASRALASALEGASVVIDVFPPGSPAPRERIGWIRQVLRDRQRRLVHAAGLSAHLLRRGGPLDVEARELRQLSAIRIAGFRNARWIRLTTPAGTDLRLEVTGRPFRDDLDVAPGSMGNLPFGEICCAPHERSAHGVVVCDGTAGGLGPVEGRPMTLRIREGRVTRIEASRCAIADQLADRLAIDDGASLVGELGFGFNPRARWTGNILEDEKAPRTAHLGFGSNGALPGGVNHSGGHLDLVVHLPTVESENVTGRRQLILRHGELVPSGFEPKIALDEIG